MVDPVRRRQLEEARRRLGFALVSLVGRGPEFERRVKAMMTRERPLFLVSSFDRQGPFELFEMAEAAARRLSLRALIEGKAKERPEVTDDHDTLPLRTFAELLDAPALYAAIEGDLWAGDVEMTEPEEAQRRLACEACAALGQGLDALTAWEKNTRHEGAWWLRLSDPAALHVYRSEMRRTLLALASRAPDGEEVKEDLEELFREIDSRGS